jgi:MFS transporter, DHA2 family, multidrug resistance protein
VRPAYVMSGGLTLAAIGYLLLAQVDGASPLALVVAASVVFSLGEAPVFTLATDLIVGTAPAERAGTAAAISETSSELGGALGIAILGTIGAAVYRSQVAVPAAVPSQAAEAAQDTLGGAVATSEELPDPLATELLDSGREAFTSGLQLAALTSAVIAAATAAMVALLLRQVRAGSALEEKPGDEPAEARARA